MHNYVIIINVYITGKTMNTNSNVSSRILHGCQCSIIYRVLHFQHFFLLKLTLLFFSKTKNDKTNIFVTSNNFSIKLRSFLCVFSFFFSNVCVFCEVSVLLCVYVALYMRFLLYINNVLLFFVKCFFFFVNYTFFFN